jgi:hypothetical protein
VQIPSTFFTRKRTWRLGSSNVHLIIGRIAMQHKELLVSPVGGPHSVGEIREAAAVAVVQFFFNYFLC